MHCSTNTSDSSPGNYYEALGVLSTASTDEIRKAYHRKALQCHPDHNSSATAHDEFTLLARVYETLSDPTKRQLYDEYGANGSSLDNHSDNLDVTAFWNSIFPKVSETDISEFEHNYIGSEMEWEDVSEAFHTHQGNLKKIFDTVPFANSNQVDRICGLLRDKLNAQYTAKEIKAFKTRLSHQEARQQIKWQERETQRERDGSIILSTST